MSAQTYLPITDNMVIGSYSNIKFAAGNYEFTDAPADGVIQINGVQNVKLDGNIYKHNKCNYSHYELWLGYSFNAVLDSNEIIGNYLSGLAIDRGWQT